MKDYRERRQKRLEKFRKNYEERREFYRLLKKYAWDIMDSRNFQSTRNFIQHGTMPVHRHCLDVANQSIRISKRLGIPCSEKDLIRGALLHDYFLYDWHQKYKPTRNVGLHGRIHPKIALFNARKDFNVNYLEADIIERHMFPLTFMPPRYRESLIVCLVDKACSVYETFTKNAYVKITLKVADNKRERRIISKRLNPYG